MGSLQKVFAAYDAMRTEGHQDEPPPWEPIPEKKPAQSTSSESKPAQSTPSESKPTQPTPQSTPSETSVPQPNLSHNTTNWNNVRADKEEKAAQLLEQRLNESRQHITKQDETIEKNLHAGHANKLMMDRINMPNGGVTFKQDEKGLDAAYGYKSFPGAAYDPTTRTLYVAGSDSWESWFHDDPLIPFGKTSEATRYKQAERAYDDLTQKYGQSVDRIVGHSLGASSALELAKNKGIPFTRTFGAPVFDPNPFHRGTVERYRHPLDPVSIFDRGATWGGLVADQPHTYGGFRHFDAPVPKPIRGLDLDHKTLALRARSGYSYV